ncbi:MAG: hypothetical protein HOP28_16575 [Gemmatimonadales bacterium]|nr:hypothetical protein [Gemmatimonadales bacterium]
MTMTREAFEVAAATQEGPRAWQVAGRAYQDIHLHDVLATAAAPDEGLRVVRIVTYNKSTDLLSAMMTGTVTLHGDLRLDETLPRFLYVARE